MDDPSISTTTDPSLTDFSFNQTVTITSGQQQFIGWTYVTFCGLDFIVYGICLFFLNTEPKLMEMSEFFKFSLHMGMADLGQIVFNSMAGGILTLVNGYDLFWTNSVCSAFLGCCMITYLILAHLMAFGRLKNRVWRGRGGGDKGKGGKG